MYNKIFTGVMFFLLFSSVFAQAPSATWAKSMLKGKGRSELKSLNVGVDGDIYVAGSCDAGSYDLGNGVVVSCPGSESYNDIFLARYDKSGNAIWAKSLVNAKPQPNSSDLEFIIEDLNKNIYTFGTVYYPGIYDFGSGVKLNNTNYSVNAFVLKYDNKGNPIWVRTSVGGSHNSGLEFGSGDVDNSGNIYVTGSFETTDTIDFGKGVVIPKFSAGMALLKYNSNGDPIWAKSATLSDSSYYIPAFFQDACVADDNVYAVGQISLSQPQKYDFGNGVIVSKENDGLNALLVKYKDNGDAQWAKVVIGGEKSFSGFGSVARDNSGNLYVAGVMAGVDQYDFGNGVAVAGANKGANTVLVKYDSDGNAQWAKTVTQASNDSWLNSVVVDAGGNIYAAGLITGTGKYDFGNGVVVAGVAEGDNVLLVKYNNNGDAQWAKSMEKASDNSGFEFLALDGNGAIYAAGSIEGSQSFDFGNSTVVNGTCSDGRNMVLVKYTE